MVRAMRVLALALALAACGGPRARISDQPDAPTEQGGADASAPAGDGAQQLDVYVYAHSSSTLYRVDPDTLAITKVGDFGWPSNVLFDQMTDIAIDKNGRMIGVSFTNVYSIDTATAQTTLLSQNLQGTFNGLSFVPAAQLGMTGDDVLVGSRNSDGMVFRIDPMTGAATAVGDMGGGFVSSGDLVAVAGFGTVQTVTGSGNDRLVRLAPQTFAATAIGTDTGFGQIWGLAFWKNKVYGFTNGGDFVLIDPTTGAGQLVAHQDVAWWGAAVTTVAPVIQ
jgi:hypothetical protein